jgi:class 3 adenylate cyclase
MFLEDLGRRLRERREQRRLKQADVANAVQVTPQAVSKWERGENAPDIILLPSLAKVLDVSTDWLLGSHAGEGDAFAATVLVSSVQGFTARCEGLRIPQIAIWSNGFFHQLTEAALEHGGIPVKYMGDGFLAFFAGRDHATRAVTASVVARDAMADPVVIGLATGEIHLASIGHVAYARPDILGSTVNRAFRVNAWAAANSESRIAATGVLEDELIGRFHIGQAVEAALKGIEGLVRMWEIIGRLETPSPADCESA